MAKGISTDILKREALFLADLIINRYTSEDGGLFQKVEVKDGKVIDSRCAIDELGDYIQYITYLGTLISETEYVDWSVRTLDLIARNYQSKKGLFYNRVGAGLGKKRLLSLNIADTITGLVSSYLYSKSDILRPIIVKFIEGTFNHFETRGYLTYGYLAGDKVRITMSNLLFTAYFIEEVLFFSEFVGEGLYLKRIKEFIDTNLSSGYFLNHGIFQARIPLGATGPFWRFVYRYIKKDSLETTFLVKDNVYFLFALLKYYIYKGDSAIKEVITNTYNNLMALFSKDGQVYNNWNPVKGCMSGPSDLALSHSIIELQLDLCHDFNDEAYLQQAIELTDRWLDRQSTLGVMNETLSETGHYSLLDSNVDFAINLLKLYEKTGQTRYLEKAYNIGSGIIKYFKAQKGYCWKIDTIDGSPLETGIETKYLGLLLKLFLVFMEVADSRSIFETPLVRNLARDR